MKKIIIYSVVCLLLISCVLFFFFLPLLKEIRLNAQKFSEIKREEDALLKFSKEFKQETQTVKEIKAVLKKCNEIFVNPEAPIPLIEFFETTARDCGLVMSLSVISPSTKKEETKKEKTWEKLAFQLSVFGDFPSTAKFLNKIESSPYLLKVKKIVARKATEKEETSEAKTGVRTNIILEVFTKTKKTYED